MAVTGEKIEVTGKASETLRSGPSRVAPDDGRHELDLAVGALVVYGSHGLGRVTGRKARHGGASDGPTVVVEFASGLSVILPLERAESCLRAPAGAHELEAARAALRARPGQTEQAWRDRTQTTRTKIALGGLVELAEVVRDAVERQRLRASGSMASPAEQELYRKARRLLAAEVAVAGALDESEAGTWIEDQLDRTAG